MRMRRLISSIFLWRILLIFLDETLNEIYDRSARSHWFCESEQFTRVFARKIVFVCWRVDFISVSSINISELIINEVRESWERKSFGSLCTHNRSSSSYFSWSWYNFEESKQVNRIYVSSWRSMLRFKTLPPIGKIFHVNKNIKDCFYVTQNVLIILRRKFSNWRQRRNETGVVKVTRADI